MEDSMIINLYWERSESAIVETSIKYGKYCKCIACNILDSNEDAEECVNDTYLHAWDSIPPHRPIYLTAYLGKITRNLALNKYKLANTVKRGGGTVTLLLNELEDCIPARKSVEEEYEAGILAKSISDFLRSIDAQNRAIFIRRYWYSDSISMISERYQMSVSKIKAKLFRCRIKLKKYLEEEGIQL